MGKFKKLSIALTTTAFSLSMLAPVASAAVLPNEQTEKVKILVASTETTVTKNMLIKKFKEVFPNDFNFLTDKDFYMGRGHYYYPEDETIRYHLSFNKLIDGKHVYGSVEFIGETLEIESFYYDPANVSDALFPAKYSKDEAQKVAEDFIKKFTNGASYKLEPNGEENYYYGNQLLTEPIRHSFTFVLEENGIAVSDQTMTVAVLGNGQVTNFYNSTPNKGNVTFDTTQQKKTEEEILKQIKSNLTVDLRYQIDYDYQTGKEKVNLVYAPTTQIKGIHALSGKWQTANDFSETFPQLGKIEKLTDSPLPPKYNGITVEEAKALVEQFVKVDSDKVKAVIESIDEREGYNGQAIVSVSYTYQFGNSSHGSSIEINKETGEIIHYYNMREDVLKSDEETKPTKAITQQEALEEAVKHLKQWVPSYLHNYVMPIEEPTFDAERGRYDFTFPRIVNDIAVINDNIYVSIAADGTLNALMVNHQPIEKWPSVGKVIAAEQAEQKFKDSLKVKLHYVKNTQEENKTHYDLVYYPTFEDSGSSVLDATTGKWTTVYGGQTISDSPAVSHPTAEEELNYLISNNILEVKNVDTFNADAAITKGEALKIIMKSLTYFYYGYYDEQEDPTQTFTDIGPKHALYQTVENAVKAGILDTSSQNFNVNAKLTREELATWYIRALKLDEAAKHHDIYQNNFADADKIKKEYIGYAALVNALGVLEADQNSFNPQQAVTYAELAVSTIKLAHQIHAKDKDRYY